MKKLKVISIALFIIFFVGTLLTLKSLLTLESLGYSLLKVNTINDWSSNRNSPIDGIVNIGSGLYGILKNHNVPLDQIKVESELFDCFNKSNTFTHSIVITSPNAILCIRMKFDLSLFKYHIVGYSGTIK